MEKLDMLSACMQGLISAGIVMRIIFCAIKMMHEEDEAARYKKRIKNSIIMLIIAQLIFPIKEIIVSYLGNGY